MLQNAEPTFNDMYTHMVDGRVFYYGMEYSLLPYLTYQNSTSHGLGESARYRATILTITGLGDGRAIINVAWR